MSSRVEGTGLLIPAAAASPRRGGWRRSWRAVALAALPLLAVESAAATPPAFPLRVDVADRRLVDANGRPFLMAGDAAWSLMVRLTQAEVQQYLDDRSARGFNTLVVNLIEHQFGGPVNRYGAGPFTTAGDFSTPNEAYFAHVDWVIQQAADRGILVLLAPLYLGFGGGNEGWYQTMINNGTTKCRAYGRYVGQRYARFPNILWVEGGDSPPLSGLAHIEAVVAGIKEFDTVHLHTAHSSRGRSALDDYNRPWLDVNTTYTDCPGALTRSRVDANRALPFFHIEGVYEGEGASSSCLLGQAYYPVFLGGRGHVFGNNPMWLFNPGWPGALNSSGASSMRLAWAFFRSREGWGLIPDLAEEVVTAGRGSATDYAAAARTPSGASVLVYLPTARTLTVDTAQVPGPTFVAWWWNAASGAAQQIGTFTRGGSLPFTPPANGTWVLVLDDTEAALPPPGSSLYPDLAVAMTGPPGYERGARVEHTVTVTNSGNWSALAVQLISSPPPGLTFVSNSGDCNTPFPCSLGTIAIGESRTVVSTFAVPSDYSGPDPIVFTAEASTPTPEDVVTNNRASFSTTRDPVPDLTLTLTGPLGFAAGSSLPYTLTVANTGAGNAAGVQLTDPTPAGLTLLSNTGDCTTPFPCSLGALAAGESRTVVTTFAVPAGYTGADPIVNVAQVSTTTIEDDLADNEASVSIRSYAPGQYYTATPCRAVDTRTLDDGPALAAGSVRLFTLAGRCSIPPDARAVSLNVTITGASSPGHLSLWPAGTAPPAASTLNFGPGMTRANNAVIPLSGDGRLSVGNGQATGSVQAILDVSGWFQ